eukprot:7597638-Pyramimonas_sp.AAC.1
MLQSSRTVHTLPSLSACFQFAVHFVGKLEDGTVFEDTNAKGKPISFKLGANQIMWGLEKAVKNMKVGEKCTVMLVSFHRASKEHQTCHCCKATRRVGHLTVPLLHTSVQVDVPPEEAFGEFDEDSCFEVPIERAPEGLALGHVRLFDGPSTARVTKVRLGSPRCG